MLNLVYLRHDDIFGEDGFHWDNWLWNHDRVRPWHWDSNRVGLRQRLRYGNRFWYGHLLNDGYGNRLWYWDTDRLGYRYGNGLRHGHRSRHGYGRRDGRG